MWGLINGKIRLYVYVSLQFDMCYRSTIRRKLNESCHLFFVFFLQKRNVADFELQLSINIKSKHCIVMSILIGFEVLLGILPWMCMVESLGTSAALNPKME